MELGQLVLCDMEIFCILLLLEQFYKYMILKVCEIVRANLVQPEAEIQKIIADIKNTSCFLNQRDYIL